MEIKKLEVYTSLSAMGSTTAQALREAHILCTGDRPLPFILTNSELWSFGLVMNKGPKIYFVEYFNIHIDDKQPVEEQHGVKILLYALRSVLRGK